MYQFPTQESITITHCPHQTALLLGAPPPTTTNRRWVVREEDAVPFGIPGEPAQIRVTRKYLSHSPRGAFHAPNQGRGGLSFETTPFPTLTDSGLVTMTEVLWKTLTRTTGPYFLALETKVMRRRLSTTRDVKIIRSTRAQLEKQGAPSQGWGALKVLEPRFCLGVNSAELHPPLASVSTSMKTRFLLFSFAPKGCSGIQAVSWL